MGTKNNPGAFDCHADAGPDEPTFTLRAKDPVAAEVIRFWIAMRKKHYYDHPGEFDDHREHARWNSATFCAMQFEDWHNKHATGTPA